MVNRVTKPLSANLPIPEASTVRKFDSAHFFNWIIADFIFIIADFIFITVAYIKQNKERMVEGELRCKQLNAYLERLNLKKSIWLCEDASGIIVKIEYDPSTNQIVGLVLPLNSHTGIPILFSFMADTAAEEVCPNESIQTFIFDFDTTSDGKSTTICFTNVWF